VVYAAGRRRNRRVLDRIVRFAAGAAGDGDSPAGGGGGGRRGGGEFPPFPAGFPVRAEGLVRRLLSADPVDRLRPAADAPAAAAAGGSSAAATAAGWEGVRRDGLFEGLPADAAGLYAMAPPAMGSGLVRAGEVNR
jgi:hypothetical protein